jgi:hypothetical protein
MVRLAYFSLGQHEEAATEYRKALELEPGSVTLKESLEIAERKIAEKKVSFQKFTLPQTH